MMQGKDILVGGLEREVLRMSGWDELSDDTGRLLARSIRLAILFSAGHAVLPASGYFETGCGFPVVLGFRASQERGQLVLQGGAGSPDDYVAHKLEQWRGSASDQTAYRDGAERRINALEGSAWRSKSAPTDDLIVANWRLALEQRVHPLLEPFERAMSPRRAERAIERLPESLEGTVILTDNVAHHIGNPGVALRSVDRNQLRLHLARGFFGSHLNDANAGVLVGPDVAMQTAACPPNAERIRARLLRKRLHELGHEKLFLDELSEEEFARVADSAPWKSLYPKLLVRAEEATAFTAPEQRAITVSGAFPRSESKSKVTVVETVLARQNEALDKVEREDGDRRVKETAPTSSAELRKAMAANPVPISLGRKAPAEARQTADLDEIARTIFQILDSSSPERARDLIRAFDATVADFEAVHPEVVATLIEEREMLTRKLETIPTAVREGIVEACRTVGQSALAKGIESAIRVLVGN